MEFHCHVSIGKVANGQNCVGRCAYICGEKLTDELTGETFNHLSKDEVVFSQTYLPDHAPKEWLDAPEQMWAKVQETELASRSQKPQIYREFEVSLPNDLSLEQEKKIVDDICGELTADGMCCTAGIHNKDGNHHVHIIAPLRRVDENGNFLAKSKTSYALDENGEKIPVIDRKTGEQKLDHKGGKRWKTKTEDLAWNGRDRVGKWRGMVCDKINQELTKERQLDHRSYEARGIEKTPTIHHYGLSDRMEINEGIKTSNQLCEKLEKDIAGLQKLVDFEQKRSQQTERSSDEQHSVKEAPEQTPGRDFSADIRGIKTSRAESSIESADERIKQISADREAEALRLAEREQKSTEYEKQRTNMNAYDRDEERSHHMGHYL